MTKNSHMNPKLYRFILVLMIVLQIAVAFYFCMQKQGYHYDEKYSYYSSNVTNGLVPSDNAWMKGSTITDEFRVTEGRQFDYKMVYIMQTYDVHPPMYYFVLHTICSLTPGVYSKWQGLSVNIMFFILCLLMLTLITEKVTDNNQFVTLVTVALFGFSPAIFSGIVFIRMYMMLTFLCLLSLYIHICGLNKDKRKLKSFYLPVFITTYLGFMTHYYYAVFLFFLAAYMSLFLFFKKETRKESFIYAATVVGGMIVGVITYPACLSHIFRGYRGTEAIGSFMNMGNLSDRAGLFVGLIEEYVLCGSFYPMVLVLLVLYVSYSYMKKRKKPEGRLLNEGIPMIIVVTVCYFLVVLKTALMNYEEAVRYEMPIYGLIILLLVYIIYTMLKNLMGDNSKIAKVILAVCTVVVIAMQFVGLANNKVLFLYPEEANEVAFAEEHKSDDILYIYNYVNQWMIWDNVEELSSYDELFFLEMNHEGQVTDERLLNSDHIYAYVMRYDDATNMLNKIIELNPNVSKAELIEERLYADIYELR